MFASENGPGDFSPSLSVPHSAAQLTMSLTGKTIVFTGTLTMKRADATKAAEAAGAKVGSSVTKNTSILVAGPGAGAKEDDAKAKGVEVWTEDQFIAAIGGGGAGTAAAPKGGKQKAASSAEEQEDAPKAKKAKEAPAPPKGKQKAAPPAEDMEVEKPPPASPAGNKAQPSSTPQGGRTPGVDRVARGMGATVYLDYDAKLNQAVVDGPVNSNKFYIVQVLQRGSLFACWNRWGRVGEEGQNNGAKLSWGSADAAIQDFEKKFKDKSANAWAARASFVKKAGKYQLVEVEDDDDAPSGAALGKLTREQIEKGQAVLATIRTYLESEGSAPSSLTNDFYSLIPTVVGRAKPPTIDSFGILGEKEALLEFWLRMGFEDCTITLTNPLERLASTPRPPDLTKAATGIADLGSIGQALSRGKTLADAAAGGPKKPMDDQMYGAIVLYTGNAIYRALNEALRVKHANVPRYLPYVKLFFAAAECLPKKAEQLWRGIAADLYAEYEEGKEIVWWTVSSTTASEMVARGFMSQLGGKATLLKLDTVNAINIEPLSIYPHEQERLLVPGTRLKVLSRKQMGNLAEIHVKEVGNALED